MFPDSPLILIALFFVAALCLIPFGHGSAREASSVKIMRSLGWVLLLLASVLVINPLSLWEHIQDSANPYIFTDDVSQQIWPLFKWRDSGLFPDDYIADYYLDVYLPQGYVTFMGLLSRVTDLRAVSKALPYVDYLIVLIAVSMASWRLGRGAATWGSLVLGLGTGVLLFSLVGGLPRSFAYPILSILVLGLVLGKPALLVMATVAGAAFYYVTSVISGLALAIYLLILPSRWRGLDERWTLKRRLGVVALTAVSTLILVTPTLLSGERFGPMVGPDRYEEFPEAGQGGRYQSLRPSGPYPSVIQEPLDSVAGMFWTGDSQASRLWPDSRRWLNRHRNKIATGVILICALGVLLRRSSPAVLRLMIVPVVSLMGFLLATAWNPYLFIPVRYTTFAAPLVALVLLPVALLEILGRLPLVRGNPEIAKALTIMACVTWVFFTAGRDSDLALNVRIPDEDIAVYSFLDEMPGDVLVAGLPGGVVESVPYLSEKSVLYSYETHMVFHEQYMRTMRDRLSHLLEALYAVDLSPLRMLRDDYQVTHLIIEQDRYAEFGYFPPFDEVVQRLVAQSEGRPVFLEEAQQAVVFQHDQTLVLDLALLKGQGRRD